MLPESKISTQRRLFPLAYWIGGALAIALGANLHSPTAHAGFRSPQTIDVYILSVGINRYPAQSGIYNPKFAEADATAIAPALAKWLNSDPALYNAHFSTLLGANATVEGIRRAMQEIAAKASSDDVFFFAFAGMGACDTTHRSYEFAAYDTVVQADGSFRNALRARDLGALLVQIPATEEYVIVDTCGSHKALDDLHAALQPPDDSHTLSLLSRKVHLLAPDQASWEPDQEMHGLLTAALLDGLAGGADFDHSGRITWDRLVGYVNWKLPELGEKYHLLENLYPLTIYGDAAGPQAPTRGFETKPEEPSPGESDLGQDYALLVATDHYAGGWPELHNPIFDISTLREVLVRSYGFRNDADHIIELHDANKHDIEPAIEKLMAKHFGKRDRLLVYFAGHGLRTPIDGYLVFSNSKPPQIEDATDSMISFSEISSALNRIQVPHLLLVLDVCYGGLFNGMVGDAKTSFQSMLGSGNDETASSSELIRRALEANSRIYIASGDENHAVSDGDPGQHSPFSRRFLAVLEQNQSKQPFLDVATLFNGLRSLPREPKAGYFYSAHVEQGADYIFIPQSQSTLAPASAGGQ